MNPKRFEFDTLKPVLLFIALGLIFYFFYADITQFIARYSIAALVLGIALILFVWKYARVIKLSLSHRPAIVLTDDGIEIGQTNMLIYWEDVANVYINGGGSGKFDRSDWFSRPFYLVPWKTYHLIVKVKQAEKYIEKIDNPAVRRYRWWVRNLDPGTFEADLTLVKGDQDQILEAVLASYQKNRTRLIK